MTISADSLERAVRRYWFRNPKADGTPFVKLSRRVRDSIVAEALKIERELIWEMSR